MSGGKERRRRLGVESSLSSPDQARAERPPRHRRVHSALQRRGSSPPAAAPSGPPFARLSAPLRDLDSNLETCARSMSEQQQPESHGREPTVSEISAAGAPNYRGRALHPQVQIDDKGLTYIGPIPPNKQDKRTVSVPVKLVALGEQGQEQYTVRASDDNDRLELVVSSGPDLLRIDRRSPTSGGARTPWLTVPAKNLSYVKVSHLFE